MCNCIEQMQKMLEESGKNTMLDIPMYLDKETKSWKADKVTIAVCKRDETKREKAVRIFPIFCPFCGIPYEKDKSGWMETLKTH